MAEKAARRVGPATDLSQWRLCCNDKGRQRWMYLEGEEVEVEDVRGTKRVQDFIELHSLGLDTVSSMLCTGHYADR